MMKTLHRYTDTDNWGRFAHQNKNNERFTDFEQFIDPKTKEALLKAALKDTASDLTSRQAEIAIGGLRVETHGDNLPGIRLNLERLADQERYYEMLNNPESQLYMLSAGVDSIADIANPSLALERKDLEVTAWTDIMAGGSGDVNESYTA